MMDAIATAAIVLAAVAFAYMFFSILESLMTLNITTYKLDVEFEQVDQQLRELRQEDKTDGRSSRIKIDKRSNNGHK